MPKVGSGTAPDIVLKEMRSVQEAHKPYTWAVRYSRAAIPLHFTLKFKSKYSRIFWKGAKMKLWRRGSVWKEQMDYFFLSWRMRSAPVPPPYRTPPSAHAHLGGGRILKGRLRQCAQQRTSRDQRPSANPKPSANSLNHLFSEPWRQWRQHRLNCSSSAGTFSACCCR